MVDGAQLVAHRPVDVESMGADFFAFSSHKLLGPTGIGVLWGRHDALEELEPFEGGGEMISDVTLEGATWAPIPHRFEAGTPPITEAVGLAAAIDYLDDIGMETVAEHDRALTAYAVERLCGTPGVAVQGPTDTDKRGGAVSFTMGDIHPHDLATILDEQGVAVRAGHHCAKPLDAGAGCPSHRPRLVLGLQRHRRHRRPDRWPRHRSRPLRGELSSGGAAGGCALPRRRELTRRRRRRGRGECRRAPIVCTSPRGDLPLRSSAVCRLDSQPKTQNSYRERSERYER